SIEVGGSTLIANAGSVTVVPAAASNSELTLPSTVVAGTAFAMTARLYDAYDNAVTTGAALTATFTLASTGVSVVGVFDSTTTEYTISVSGEVALTLATGQHTVSLSVTGSLFVPDAGTLSVVRPYIPLPTSSPVSVTAGEDTAMTVTVNDSGVGVDGLTVTLSASSDVSDGVVLTYTSEGKYIGNYPVPLSATGSLTLHVTLSDTLGRYSDTTASITTTVLPRIEATVVVETEPDAEPEVIDETSELSLTLLAPSGEPLTGLSILVSAYPDMSNAVTLTYAGDGQYVGAYPPMTSSSKSMDVETFGDAESVTLYAVVSGSDDCGDTSFTFDVYVVVDDGTWSAWVVIGVCVGVGALLLGGGVLAVWCLHQQQQSREFALKTSESGAKEDCEEGSDVALDVSETDQVSEGTEASVSGSDTPGSGGESPYSSHYAPDENQEEYGAASAPPMDMYLPPLVPSGVIMVPVAVMPIVATGETLLPLPVPVSTMPGNQQELVENAEV
ncbi:hypothetical protein KIPB_008364, partial [Kipferlia bialata]